MKKDKGKDINVTVSLLAKANNVYVNEKGEFFLSDGYNNFKYIGKTEKNKYKAK